MKKAKTILAAAMLAAALSGNLFAAAPPYGALSVDGNKIVGANGKPVVLRGMSFFWSNPGWPGGRFYTAGAVNTLADDWKATIVRAAVGQASGGGDWQAVADAAIAKGIYVVIDWHTHDKGTQSQAISFFTTNMPARFKNSPNVIFEIFNEPCSGSAVGGTGTCGGDNWASDIKPYAVALINAIRGNGFNNLIVIGTPDYSKLKTMDPSKPANSAIASPVTGANLQNASYANNLAYTVHFYTAEPGTYHQGDLRGVCDQALNAGLALMVTEWGLSEADGGQKNTSKINTAEANTWFEYMDRNYISWMNWSIHTKGEAASALTGGSGNGSGWTTSQGGTFVKNALIQYNTARTLTVKMVPETGAGTVSGTRPSYKHGDYVIIKAEPASGWEFAGWSGDGVTSAGEAQQKIYLTSNRTITVTFAQGGNLVTNGTFSPVAADGWTLQRSGGGALSLANNSSGGGLVSVTATGTACAVRQNVMLENGKRYRLSFDARTVSGTRNMPVTVGSYLSIEAALTTTNKSFSQEFNMTGSTGNVLLAFDVNEKTGDLVLNNVRIELIGTTAAAAPPALAPLQQARAAWSLSRMGGGVTLRGPAESGAKVTLYDIRGKAVRTMSARDGMSLAAKGVPAGSYFLVVRNASGKEVFRDRVSFVR
jgi:endoglucanase